MSWKRELKKNETGLILSALINANKKYNVDRKYLTEINRSLNEQGVRRLLPRQADGLIKEIDKVLNSDELLVKLIVYEVMGH